MILQRGWENFQTPFLPFSLSRTNFTNHSENCCYPKERKSKKLKENVDWSIAFLDLSILKRSLNDSFFYIPLDSNTRLQSILWKIFSTNVKSINCFCKYTRDLWDSTDPIIPFSSISLGFSKQVENIDDDQTQFGNKSDVERIETSWKHRSNSFRALVPR